MTRFGGQIVSFPPLFPKVNDPKSSRKPVQPYERRPRAHTHTPEEAKAPQPVEPPLDERELQTGYAEGPFSPPGICPWCDRRRGWVAERRKPKRAVQRKKRWPSGSKEERLSAAT